MVSSILLHRLTKTREKQIREEQAGFLPGRGMSIVGQISFSRVYQICSGESLQNEI
jgi:hypothetical protein